MTELTFAALCGSLRRASMTRMLRATLPDLAPKGVHIVDVEIDAVPLFNGDIRADSGTPPAVTALCEALAAADAVVLCSPEYNRMVPGALKNAMDWVSTEPGFPMSGKPVAVMTQSPGPRGGNMSNYAWRQVLSVIGAEVVPGPDVSLGLMEGKVDGGKLVDEPSRKLVAKQLGLLADRARLLKG
ncbi:MAG: NAD(P)H-dependent oxidoreductase [Rhodobacteraceae bacterium]|nr:NAD(P)H-dependent oxidoreductase [Paracoccaceae bacterium]MBR9821086.1 NAD(P)H-dependent oxidoreductase [Paracoccaceae bacterium]